MKLPRGITGFRHIDDPLLPVSDCTAFRSYCYEAARALRGHVVSVEAPIRGTVANFARAIIDLRDGPAAVLLNAHFPVIAFARPRVQNGAPVSFIDAPALAEVFRLFGTYEVWSRSQLESPVQRETCSNLAEAELEQVKYWKPARVGDVVFNFWD